MTYKHYSLGNALADVELFMVNSGQLNGSKSGHELAKLYGELIKEEVIKETLPALEKVLAKIPGDTVENAAELNDGIADSIWVLLGLAISLNLPIAEQWQEVTRANMDKVEGGAEFDSNGKIIKPIGWRPPDSVGIIMKSLDKFMAESRKS